MVPKYKIKTQTECDDGKVLFFFFLNYAAKYHFTHMKQCYIEKPALLLGNVTTKASSKSLSKMSTLHIN